MLNFTVGAFAVAGLVAAAGPIIIHLLNRRRYRTVNWAAMDFLREAMQRNRKVLQLRDLLVLALRVLAVLVFGLALARPFFTTGGGESFFRSVWLALALVTVFAAAIWAVVAAQRATKIAAGAVCGLAALLSAWGLYGVVQSRAAGETGALSSRAPVHAVLVIDNSQSMGYETLQGNLLDLARAKAAEFIDVLPSGSRISVVPLCGSEGVFSLDAYRTKDDARDALNRIKVVDLGGRAASAVRAVELAADACQRVPELESKRVVYIGDQQLINWPSDGMQAALEKLPELQVVQVAADSPENVWISDFRLQDGIADVETPAVFLATVRYHGPSAQANVQITLSIDDAAVATQTVDLEPGQARQIEFKHQLDVMAEPGEPTFVIASVAAQTAGVAGKSGGVEGDRLASDNQRHLAVPVVAGLPVVFVDQYGPDEDLEKNRVGESYRLRRLLAPRTSRDDSRRQLVQVRHTTVDKLDFETLEDARLVVISGVAQPGSAVPLLREYVKQGGQLVITAGAEFDPSAWTEQAWLDGLGILPAPLKSQPIGETPEEAVQKGRLEPFFLAFESLENDEFFRIEQEPTESLRDLYRLPIFFKAVQVDLDESVVGPMLKAEASRIEEERAFLAVADERQQPWAQMEQSGTFGPTEESLRTQDDQRRRTVDPQWLLWSKDESAGGREVSAADLAERSRPLVRASYAGSNLPFLVERKIGDGRVLFFSSGAYSSWNTLTTTNAILVFDRIFRHLLEETIPTRNFDAGTPITLAVERGERLEYSLTRPTDEEQQAILEEVLSVDALGPEVYGVAVRNPLRSGRYLVTARRLESDSGSGLIVSREKSHVIPLAVNGPAEESELRVLDAAALGERLGDANYRWVGPDEAIALEGARVRGRDLWKVFATLALVCLLVEMLVLAWPVLAGKLAGRQPA